MARKAIYVAVLGVMLALIVGTTLVLAQGALIVNQPFRVLSDHDGANTTSYQLTITGPSNYSASLPVSGLSGGVITFAVAGLANAGSHTAIVSAVGPGGTTASDPFVFVVGAAPAAKPTKPTNVRIVPG